MVVVEVTVVEVVDVGEVVEVRDVSGHGAKRKAALTSEFAGR